MLLFSIIYWFNMMQGEIHVSFFSTEVFLYLLQIFEMTGSSS